MPNYIIDDVGIASNACNDVMQRKVVEDLNGDLHCVYEKDVTVGVTVYHHTFYGLSQDNGATWTTEDIMDGLTIDAFNSNIVIDSSNIPHVLYKDKRSGLTYGWLKYQNRSGGSWSAPETLYQGIYGSNRTGGFDIGEDVVGDDSGATITIGWRAGAYLIPDGVSSDPGFIVNEWIRGQTSGAKMRYQGFIAHADEPSMGIDSTNQLHIAFFLNIPGVMTKTAYIFRNSSLSWYWPEKVSDQSDTTAIAIGPSDEVNIVIQDGQKFYFTTGNLGSWSASENFANATGTGNFSIAVDSDGHSHIVMSQKGLGGTNSNTLNIHYYKRTLAGVWSSVEHITEDGTERKDPTIALNKDGEIIVVFRGSGYGTETADPNIVVRIKNGSWGTVEVLIDRVLEQYVPILKSSLYPVSNSTRPNYPQSGYALIWSAQNTNQVEYYVPNMAPTAPTGLLTEGETNPATLETLTPYFSAIFNDPDSGDIAQNYEIEVNTASDFSGASMWDTGKTSMTDVTEGNRCPNVTYAGTTLVEGTTYYWRIRFWDDDDAQGAWSATANFRALFTPTAPTDLRVSQCPDEFNPIEIKKGKPRFSAIFNDPNSSDIADNYQVQVNTNSSFTGTEMWDSGKVNMDNLDEGERCTEIPYQGTELSEDGASYYWRIKFWDDEGNEGNWPDPGMFTMAGLRQRTTLLSEIRDSSLLEARDPSIAVTASTRSLSNQREILLPSDN